MAIVAKCGCGHRVNLSDVMAGRTIRCANCGGDLVVPESSATPASKSPSKPTTVRNNPGAMPAISIHPALIIFAIVVVVVMVIVLTLYFGPWRVGNQWAAMSAQANNQVSDVVLFAIQAYESEQGTFDASQSHMVPRIEGDVAFVPPMMAFSLPRRIPFSGATSQGSYMGTYDTTDGEVIADIQTGGATVGGLISTRNATGSFHVTGREKNGVVEAETDGHSLRIIIDAPKDGSGH